MRRYTIWFAGTLLLSGCGASATPADTGTAACERSRAEAERAWSRLADLTAPEPTTREEPASRPIDGVIERLRAHALSLREAPPEAVDGETALTLSGAVMDALDSLPDVSESARREVDDAAEALLTERTPGGSMRAASLAVQVLEAAVSGPATTEIDLSQVGRGARNVAEGYAEGPGAGDRRARSVEAQNTEGWAPEVAGAHATAVAASQQTRRECGITRALLVATP